jgi:hypothetical protein
MSLPMGLLCSFLSGCAGCKPAPSFDLSTVLFFGSIIVEAGGGEPDPSPDIPVPMAFFSSIIPERYPPLVGNALAK